MLEQKIKEKINVKTKPLGSLGKLEALALQIGLAQNTLNPALSQPTIVVFAADHGIAAAGVSAYPAEVTTQMVLNFLNGGAAINVFCAQNNITLKVVDAGVNADLPKHPDLIDAKVAKGTKSFLKEEAMTVNQLQICFQKAEGIIQAVDSGGCNIIGFGEMGIGNTSSSSLLMSYLLNIPLNECIGKGTGLNDAQLQHKITLLAQAQRHHPQPKDVMQALQLFGGFEIAQICGAMLAAYEKNMLIMVDGFITSVAFLCAHRLNEKILSHAIFCHQSNEQGHLKLLQHLDVDPILALDMRLGEGTGCAIAYPIIKSAITFLNEMASFESANVSTKDASQ